MVRSTFMTKRHIISDKLKEKNQTQILRSLILFVLLFNKTPARASLRN